VQGRLRVLSTEGQSGHEGQSVIALGHTWMLTVDSGALPAYPGLDQA
jgi:hypothetical protein